MSSPPPRRPSTLAAQKFAAAQRPLGTPPVPRANARYEALPMMGVGRSSGERTTAAPARLVSSVPLRTRVPRSAPPVAAARSAARTVAEPAPPARDPQALLRRAERERTESLLVTSVIIVLMIGLIAFAFIRIAGERRVDQSRTTLNGTFGKVFEQQGTFRIMNNRFATWRELAANGARLGPGQRVIASNASASHWFLSVLDTENEVICSRTGELFDESPRQRPATCVDASP